MIQKIKYSTILLVFIFLYSCQCECNGPHPNNDSSKLELVYSTILDVEEPSGLDLGLDNKCLWTVSDDKNKIYKLNLSGTVLKELSIPSTDLEGISYSHSDSTIWIVSESQGQIIQIDTLGNAILSKKINAVKDGGGLEGITINSLDNHIFLVKENNPSVLIELNSDLETVLFKRISTAQDYSGIDYDEVENQLWLVSDQNNEILLYDINGRFIESFPIKIDKAEGIAVDNINKLIYIVSDSADSLYVYQVNTEQ